MNGFTSGAAEQLSEAFKSNCTLQYVDLSDNDIDDQGATLLSSGVEGMKSLAEFGLNRIMYSERSGGEGFEGRGMAEREAVQEAASEDQARTRGLGRALRRRVTACTYSLCIQVTR